MQSTGHLLMPSDLYLHDKGNPSWWKFRIQMDKITLWQHLDETRGRIWWYSLDTDLVAQLSTEMQVSGYYIIAIYSAVCCIHFLVCRITSRSCYMTTNLDRCTSRKADSRCILFMLCQDWYRCSFYMSRDFCFGYLLNNVKYIVTSKWQHLGS